MTISGAPFYDDESAINDHLVDLFRFHGLLEARQHAAHVQKKKLKEWCIYGRLHLTDNGGYALITEAAPVHVNPAFFEFRARPWADACEQSPNMVMTQRVGVDLFPPALEKCGRCQHVWTMRSIFDAVCDYTGVRQQEKTWYHRACMGYVLHDRARDEFAKSFAEAGIPVVLEAIPNEYWGLVASWPTEPWFWAYTEQGVFKVGWRKRVISLEWERCDIDAKGLFDKEDVTRDEHMIHAWGQPKLVDYLRRLKAAPKVQVG